MLCWWKEVSCWWADESHLGKFLVCTTRSPCPLWTIWNFVGINGHPSAVSLARGQEEKKIPVPQCGVWLERSLGFGLVRVCFSCCVLLFNCLLVLFLCSSKWDGLSVWELSFVFLLSVCLSWLELFFVAFLPFGDLVWSLLLCIHQEYSVSAFKLCHLDLVKVIHGISWYKIMSLPFGLLCHLDLIRAVSRTSWCEIRV